MSITINIDDIIDIFETTCRNTNEDYDDPEAPSYGIKQIGAVRLVASAKHDIEEELRYFGVCGEHVYPNLSDTCQYIREKLNREYEDVPV